MDIITVPGVAERGDIVGHEALDRARDLGKTIS